MSAESSRRAATAAALFNYRPAPPSAPGPMYRSTSFNHHPAVAAEADSTSDLRRATSMRVPGSQTTYGSGAVAGPGPSTSRILDARRDVAGLSSFTSAGSALSSPAFPPIYTPPAAARHPLFSHHAGPSSGASSPTMFSDPGPSSPPSPTGSSRSGGFSPASAFLSHFSSSSSLRPPAPSTAGDPSISSATSAVSDEPLDAPGSRVLDYTLGKLVGRGGFSSVRKATHVVTGAVLACKIVKRDDLSDRSGSVEKFEEEIRTWRSLPRHPSLLPMLEILRTPTMTFFIMPYLPGGSLLDVLRREGGSEKTASKWFPGVVRAVAAMHEGFQPTEGGETLGAHGFEGRMLHGDLKLDNFLVDHSGKVMVCDFYMAQFLGPRSRSPSPNTMSTTSASVPPPSSRGRSSLPLPSKPTRRSFPASQSQFQSVPLPNNDHLPALPPQSFPSASLPYAPPELLRTPPAPPSLAQDIWALGIILHALLTGRLPFVDAFDPRLQMKILRGTWDIPTDLGKEWVECLHGCLDGDRERRWTIRRVRECDAVIGWHEVRAKSKGRSKSRSRSRMRDGHDLLDPTATPTRRGLFIGSDAMPIRFDGSRGRGVSRSRDREGQALASMPERREHIDTFAPSTTPFLPSGPGGRSRSASASHSGTNSRSRSSGRDLFFGRPDREMHEPTIDEVDMNNMHITRGRSTAIKSDAPPGFPTLDSSSSFGTLPQSPSARSALGLGLQERPRLAIDLTPLTSRQTSRAPSTSRSRSRPRQADELRGMVPMTAPPSHPARPSYSPQHTRRLSPTDAMHVDSPEDPSSASSRSRSRSRGRALPTDSVWGMAMSPPEAANHERDGLDQQEGGAVTPNWAYARYGQFGELRTVEEEGGRQGGPGGEAEPEPGMGDRRSRSRGRQGRSRSRARG